MIISSEIEITVSARRTRDHKPESPLEAAAFSLSGHGLPPDYLDVAFTITTRPTLHRVAPIGRLLGLSLLMQVAPAENNYVHPIHRLRFEFGRRLTC